MKGGGVGIENGRGGERGVNCVRVVLERVLVVLVVLVVLW